MQDRTVLQLTDGKPVTLKFTDLKDVSKYMYFILPHEEMTV